MLARVAPLLATGMDESKIRREGVCAASLPTTMGIIAGVLAQNALKFLLGFGSVASCWTYASLSDFSSHVECRPNPECRSEECRAAQAREAAKGGSKNRGAGVGAAPSQNQGGRAMVSSSKDTGSASSHFQSSRVRRGRGGTAAYLECLGHRGAGGRGCREGCA